MAITERDKKYYRLGYERGEHKLRETILLLQRTNRCLWNELLRLDKNAPIAGVVLTYTEVEGLIHTLRKNKASLYQARKLDKKSKEAKREGRLFSLLAPRKEL